MFNRINASVILLFVGLFFFGNELLAQLTYINGNVSTRNSNSVGIIAPAGYIGVIAITKQVN